MDRKVLKSHKHATKQLVGVPSFSPLKKNSLPGQFKRMGRPRVQSSGFHSVSESHAVLFIWRDGETLADRLFYAYFVEKTATGALRTLLEFHWHPSHKGFHCVTPCGSDLDYTGRMLPGGRDINLSTNPKLDPANENDRLALIERFCAVCGIKLAKASPGHQGELWN